VKENVIDYFDHSVVISSRAGETELKNIREMFDKFYIVPYQPTCENMIIHFAEIISAKLPSEIKLFSLKLCETATSYAEWFASDNQ
jgi:6-pyruvoyltetrahydropterin/6-carboxytetrahydropterin synthase